MVNVNFEIVFIIEISTFRCLFYKRFIFEEVVPLSNDPIMLKRLIQSFGHLKHQNLSIFSDSIGRARMVQQFGQKRGTKWIRTDRRNIIRGWDKHTVHS